MNLGRAEGGGRFRWSGAFDGAAGTFVATTGTPSGDTLYVDWCEANDTGDTLTLYTTATLGLSVGDFLEDYTPT